MLTNTDWLEYRNVHSPDKEAIVDKNISYSYKDLHNRVNYLSAYFLQNGVQSGEIVPVILHHHSQFIITVFALWRIGAIVAPLSPKFPETELKKLVLFLDCSVYISEETSEFNFVNYKKITPDLTYKKSFSGNSLWNMNKSGSAIIIFTSGTTSIPKGVLISFDSLYNSFTAISKFDNYSSHDTFLASLPFNHIGGFSIIIRSLLCGGTLLFPQNTSHSGILEGILKLNPTIISLVPTVLNRLVKSRIQPNPKLRSVYVGGASSSESTIKGALKAGFPIIKVYGSTETSAMVCAYRPSLIEGNINASGYALPGNSIYISDQYNKPAPKGMEGEIVIESPALFTEYFKNLEETQEKKKNKNYYTGDIGVIDSNGLLTVFMRRTDLIISGGENISPIELEKEIAKLNFIKEVYVLGVDDDDWGQVVVAVFTTNNNNIPENENVIRQHLLKSLPSFKIPKFFIQLKHIPKNEMGKPNRNKLLKIILQDVRLNTSQDREE
ncbi:MAG: acyl--CoA ligase [Bacteroidetes bacterium]|nr:acyl--CoA ligase [Bacteroidota bacterium]